MEVKGYKKLINSLERKIKRAKQGTVDGKAVASVGYLAYYAIYVHWNLEAFHPNGRALFLTEPYDKIKDKAPARMTRLMKRGASLPQALITICYSLQTASQKIVPFKTGELKASAYTKLEKGSL